MIWWILGGLAVAAVVIWFFLAMAQIDDEINGGY